MDQLSRIIQLIQKTGDKMVVTDLAGHPAYVVMTLKDYEKIVLGQSDIKDLTEEELLAKINRDVALWKANQNAEIIPEFSQKIAPDAPVKEEEKAEEEYYVEPVEKLES
jgi:ribosome-binding protein aMBF1 (putative translation factor)